MTCEICNCPMTLLRTASGKKERRKLCIRCREDEDISAQVGLLEEHAAEIGIPPARTSNVLRIDQYLLSRKRKTMLM